MIPSNETLVQPQPAGITESARRLPPAYFAMVMATGIVSIAAERFGMHGLAMGLFILNILFYATLWLLTVLRLVIARQAMWADLTDHQRGPGFFTMVAGSCIVASQCLIITDMLPVAIVLLAVAIVLWLVLTYTIFSSFTVKETKPTLDRGITGAWLLGVVAAQSVAVVSGLLAPHAAPSYRMAIDFITLSVWLSGGMLYIWMIALIFYRYMFFRFDPGDLAPPYWINMGAMAISTLAGSLLIRNSIDSPFLQSLLPFVKGFTILYWATGTWWIPMLVILGIWRHVVKRYPLRYDPLFWGAVFPLGMYAVSTLQLANVLHLQFLEPLSRYFLFISLGAWALVFIGLLRNLGRGLTGRLSTAGK